VGLQVGGLQRNDGIGGAVRLDKAIVGEQLNIGKDGLGHVGGDAVLHGPLDELGVLLLQVLLFLLTHGTAHQVGLGKRVAGQL